MRHLVALSLLAPAAAFGQSLDCTNRDADVCAAVNGLVPMVNAEAGSTVLTQSSSRNAFRPTGLYNALLQVRNAAVNAGCDVDGFAGGVYDLGSEDWSGGHDYLGGGSFDALGTCTASPADWNGAATDGSVIGTDVGRHNAAGQIAADVDDDGFMAGYWYRTAGSRGVYVSLLGTCPGDAGDALDPWWSGDLASFGAPSSCAGTLFDPGNGIVGCWYQGAPGQTCNQVCATHGGFDQVASTHVGNAVGELFSPERTNGGNWMSIECSSNDNFTNWGANGLPADGDWQFSTPSACNLNCACNE